MTDSHSLQFFFYKDDFKSMSQLPGSNTIEVVNNCPSSCQMSCCIPNDKPNFSPLQEKEADIGSLRECIGFKSTFYGRNEVYLVLFSVNKIFSRLYKEFHSLLG